MMPHPGNSPTLEAKGLSLRYSESTVVDGLDLLVPSEAITVLVGANGCGKLTLLRGLARLLPAHAGGVLLDGKDIAKQPTAHVAKRLGILPQSPTAPDGITVAELVGRGRQPHRSWFGTWSAADENAVGEALAMTGLVDLADRSVDALSGGQRQRVWIAMALAQNPPLLLLDEPTTFLDLSHQIEVLDLLTELHRARGTTIVAVLHDLNLAFRYADHLIAMRDGAITAQGAPSDIVTEQLLADVFGLTCRIEQDPISRTPTIFPIGRYHPGDDQAARSGDAGA